MNSKLRILKLSIVIVLFMLLYSGIRLLKSIINQIDDEPELDYSHIYRQLTGSYILNNSLISRQANFILPSNNGFIFQQKTFEILHSSKNDSMDIRIYNQMRYVPSQYVKNDTAIEEKLILLYNGEHHIIFGDFNLCPVSKCKITTDLNAVSKADIILWIRELEIPTHRRPRNQVWALFFHESPFYTPNIKHFEEKTKSMINWTVSYRPDSTIPHPYFKYSPYDLVNPPPQMYPLPERNYSLGKNKMVAWFSSNCRPYSNRAEIVAELQRYVQVDVYGQCGRFNCPKRKRNECLELLDKEYKFYLSFENSYCRHYITEKFFINGLSRDVIPVVLGAHPDDYRNIAPPHSYIHIEDFDSIKDLANYIKYLDRNHTAFNEYFAWKSYGTVNFDQFFYCRLCMMAHSTDDMSQLYYTNIHRWWHGRNDGMCFRYGRWKDRQSSII